MPRRRAAFYILGYALGGAFGAIGPRGQARTTGAARE
jgi:hypothetical protein